MDTVQVCSKCLVLEKKSYLLESGTGRRPAQGLYNNVIMPNNSKRSRSFCRAGWLPWTPPGSWTPDWPRRKDLSLNLNPQQLIPTLIPLLVHFWVSLSAQCEYSLKPWPESRVRPGHNTPDMFVLPTIFEGNLCLLPTALMHHTRAACPFYHSLSFEYLVIKMAWRSIQPQKSSVLLTL